MRRLILILVTLMLMAGCSGGTKPAAPPPPAPTPEQVMRWRQELEAKAFQHRHVTTSGYDEVNNRIRIGVGTKEAKAKVEADAASLGIPAGIVVIEGPEPLLSEAEPLAGCQLGPPPAPGEAMVILSLSKNKVRPGEEITLTVAGVDPKEVTRGIVSYLECWDGQRWAPRFTLITAWQQNGNMPRAEVFGNQVIPDIGLAGPGPERVKVPDQLLPGWYRIRKEVPLHENGQVRIAQPIAFLEVTN